jgi:hypothetical protein
MQRALVQAECPICGRIETPTADVVCGSSEADQTALCELRCPRCGLVLLREVAPVEIPTLLLFGARKTSHPLPFELLEAHRGRALSWDDLLDFHTELENECRPQQRIQHESVA